MLVILGLEFPLEPLMLQGGSASEPPRRKGVRTDQRVRKR
jgi:hypothetical protein